MFFRIALRNVFRNKRRTAISLGVVALGVAILYLVVGFVNASLDQTKESMARQYGAVQIADETYFENRTRAYLHLIDEETQNVVNAILESERGVVAHKTELGFTGLIGNLKGSSLLTANGFVPGNDVDDFSDYIIEGEAMKDTEELQLVLGKSLADAMDLGVGSRINVASSTTFSTFGAVTATVVGIMRYNDLEAEGELGFINMETAQRVIKAPGFVERIVIKTENVDNAPAFAASLQAKLDASPELKQLAEETGLVLTARPWQDLSPLYASVQDFSNFFTLFTYIGVFILAFFSVLEVLTMAFLERKREVGTVRAVGTQRTQVFSMFLQEGIILGIFGGIIGIVGGTLLAAWINGSSLSWMPPGTIEPVPIVIALSPVVASIAFLAALVSAFLGTLYPAFRNSRRNIVESLSTT
jgi:putative ABC transport system permease protein